MNRLFRSPKNRPDTARLDEPIGLVDDETLASGAAIERAETQQDKAQEYARQVREKRALR